MKRMTLLLPALIVCLTGAMARESSSAVSVSGAARDILSAVKDERLVLILEGVLSRNPELASLEARARSHRQRPSQARSLPDPQASLTTYLQTPETRVGPQRAMTTVSQKLPWFGKRELREEAAVREIEMAEAELAAGRLNKLTEARVAYYEIGFLDRAARLTTEDRDTLRHFEELARARYASGVGLQQDVIKIQAEITKDETRLLELRSRRVSAAAALNALQGLPQAIDIPEVLLPDLNEVVVAPEVLRSRAAFQRPEMTGATAQVQRAETLVRLARKEYDPDFSFGLSYTLVDERDDPAARLSPVEDDGQDVLGLTVGVSLPIWRDKRSSAVQEAIETQTSNEEQRRDVLTRIHREVDDISARLPLIWNQLELFEKVLMIQAEESLRSVESAYAAGSVNALDLLDAERVLFQVRTASARSRADYAIALARLEGAMAFPLASFEQQGEVRP